MSEWDEILLEYESFDNIDKSEVLWLKEQFFNTSLDEDIEWNELSDNKKRIKRIFWSKMARKTAEYDNGFFRYEDSIIDLYEAIIHCLYKLNDTKQKSKQITRLKAFLCLIKMKINSHKDTKKIEDFYFSQFKSIIYECLNCSLEEYFIEKINILYLESKLEILRRLKVNETHT